MKILITGGAGFIGSHLAERLLERGDQVTIIDNFETGQRENVPVGAKLIEQDISKPFWDFEDYRRVDVVVHAAASYKNPSDWLDAVHTNVVGTEQVIAASLEHEVPRMIYLQTSLCYGLKPPDRAMKITQAQNPVGSIYAITKTAAENMIATSGIDFVSFRLANCYGPRNLSGPVPTFYKKLMNEEECTVVDTYRDFVYIDDLIDLMVKAVDGKGRGYYHVSTGRQIRIADLYYAVCDAVAVDRPVDVRRRSKDDVKTILLDPSRTESKFNWKTKTPLRKGIRAAVEYYREYGVGETYTHLRLDKT